MHVPGAWFRVENKLSLVKEDLCPALRRTDDRTMQKVPLHSHLPQLYRFKGKISPFPLGQVGASEVIGNEQSQEIATTEAGGTKSRDVTRGWRGSPPVEAEALVCPNTERQSDCSHSLPPSVSSSASQVRGSCSLRGWRWAGGAEEEVWGGCSPEWPAPFTNKPAA